jgi:sugar-specific transcriptional regulator TrmB
MDTRALERIGLTKSEIKVYLALLHLGQTTAGPIVDESRVTRSKIYDILERLRHKGLVSHIQKGKVRHFNAADPNTIVELLERREMEARKEKDAITAFLPVLLMEQRLAKNKSIAEVFTGFKGMESAFNTVAESFAPKTSFYVFGAGLGEDEKQVQRFFHRYQQRRSASKVRTHIIFNEESRGQFRSQERSSLVETRYLDQKTVTSTSVYGDYVVIAILLKEPITFLLRNKDAAASFKAHFDALWAIAKK